MSFFWTALRNGAVALSVIIVFAWITSQYAAIAHFDDAAERVWLGLPLHQPSAFLHWGFAGVRFWGPAFALALLGVLGLGAFGLTVLFGWITPPLKPLALLSTRGFAQRETLGHLGLLGANGLAVGAVRRTPWSRWEQISAPPGHGLIIGKAAWANDALLAAAASWRGALVVADGGSGLSLRLPRRDVVRWAPGRPDAISLNPMLMLRPGPNAWADAQRLAHAFLGEVSSASKDAFALLILDQLMTAPIEHRSLAGLRRRLADPGGVYETITARWGEDKALGPHARLARASAMWREQRTLTLERLRAIDERLTLYDDCAFAEASSRLQFELADLATGDGPKTLALTLPPQHLDSAAPLLRALLSELAATCASAPDIDVGGRPKQREVLLLLDAPTSAALAHANPAAFAAIITPHTSANGLTCLAAATTISAAPDLGFSAIAAIGPQSGETARALSSRSGVQTGWRRTQSSALWRAWAGLNWIKTQDPIVAPTRLTHLSPAEALILLEHCAPVLARALVPKKHVTAFVDGRIIAPAAHGWADQPALAPTLANSPKPAPQQSLPLFADKLATRISGDDIRRALSAPPKDLVP